jgi:hypothetical protein
MGARPGILWTCFIVASFALVGCKTDSDGKCCCLFGCNSKPNPPAPAPATVSQSFQAPTTQYGTRPTMAQATYPAGNGNTVPPMGAAYPQPAPTTAPTAPVSSIPPTAVPMSAGAMAQMPVNTAPPAPTTLSASHSVSAMPATDTNVSPLGHVPVDSMAVNPPTDMAAPVSPAATMPTTAPPAPLSHMAGPAPEMPSSPLGMPAHEEPVSTAPPAMVPPTTVSTAPPTVVPPIQADLPPPPALMPPTQEQH